MTAAAPRTILLGDFSAPVVLPDLVGQDLTVITASAAAATRHRVLHRTLESFASETLARSGRTVCPELLARRLLRQAVQAEGLVDPAGMARVLAGMVRQLLRANLPLEDLRPAGVQGERLGRITQRYCALLRDRQFVDEAELYWQAAAANSQAVQLALVGFNWLAPGETEFIDRLAAPGSVILLPNTDGLPYEPAGTPEVLYTENTRTANKLKGRGWTFQEATPERAPAGPRISALHYPDLDAEVRGALGSVKQLLTRGVRNDDITLVVRDENLYGPVVQDVAWEYGLRISSFQQVPLARTAVGELMTLLLDAAAGGLPFETTARLASHPFGPAITPEQWHEARRQRPTGSVWTKHGVEASLLIWAGSASSSTWRDRVSNCFDAWGTHLAAGRSAHDALALRELLGGLHDLRLLHGGPVTFAEWRSDVDELLTISSVPAEPGRHGLALHTPLAISGASYEHVFVLGVAEGILPASVGDDPALPWQLRSHVAGLESVTEAVTREELSVRTMLNTATATLVLSYPEQLGNDRTIPGLTLAQLGISPGKPEHALLASVEEERRVDIHSAASSTDDHVLQSARHALRVEQRRESPALFDEFDGVTGIPLDPADRVFSATQLTRLGQCPFRWFADQVLRLSGDDEAEDSLTPQLRGNLYHHTLEIALARVLTQQPADWRAALSEQLEDAFYEAERSVLGPGGTPVDFTALPGWELERREQLNTLRRAVNGEDFLLAGAVPLVGEQQFSGEWLGFQVRGRIDRIDRKSEGLVFVDYKTGGGKPPGVLAPNGKLDVDLQLPIYGSAAAATLYPEDDVADAYYYSLGKAEQVKVKDIDPDLLQAFAQQAADRLRKGSYPVQPDPGFKACEYCNYAPVCRVGPRQERKADGAEEAGGGQ